MIIWNRVENGVRFGGCVLLLENIGEEWDAALEPLLFQQNFNKMVEKWLKLMILQ